MKSTRAKAYINESLSIEEAGEVGVLQQDAIRAVEIAEHDMLVDQHDRNRSDLKFLEEMLEKHDAGQTDYVRQNIVDWRDELEKKTAEQKKMLNNDI